MKKDGVRMKETIFWEFMAIQNKDALLKNFGATSIDPESFEDIKELPYGVEFKDWNLSNMVEKDILKFLS